MWSLMFVRCHFEQTINQELRQLKDAIVNPECIGQNLTTVALNLIFRTFNILEYPFKEMFRV